MKDQAIESTVVEDQLALDLSVLEVGCLVMRKEGGIGFCWRSFYHSRRLMLRWLEEALREGEKQGSMNQNKLIQQIYHTFCLFETAEVFLQDLVRRRIDGI